MFAKVNGVPCAITLGRRYHTIGTAIRAGAVRAYADGAGFTDVDELRIEHDFWRVYRLVL